MIVSQMESDAVASAAAPAPGSPEPLTFDDFYRAHRDRMAHALALTLRDDDLAADATDEAFARACQRWRDVARYDNPQGWVYRVALNWARSRLRRRRREKDKEPLVVIDEQVTDAPVDVDLERALDTLPAAQRDIVVARFFMGWSVAETAEAMKIAPGTVKSRLSRALDHLQRELGGGEHT